MDRFLLVAILAGLAVIYRKQRCLNKKLNQMALTQEEAVAKLDAQAVKLEKVRAEVQALKDAATNSGNVSPELEAAIARVDNAINGVDDINPDAEEEA